MKATHPMGACWLAILSNILTLSYYGMLLFMIVHTHLQGLSWSILLWIIIAWSILIFAGILGYLAQTRGEPWIKERLIFKRRGLDMFRLRHLIW